ncbi:MAG TPA: TlpA disulfide reductase family protein [Flavobacterium sp.]|nr:TlpA disulfide reductase family protein [Flavobacterium sp.]
MKKIIYILFILVFTSCSSKLFIPYEKDGEKLERIDLVKLNKYANLDNKKFDKTTAWGSSDRPDESYILTSKNETTKIAVTKKDGIYIFLKKIKKQKDQYIVTEYNPDGSFKSKTIHKKTTDNITPKIEVNYENLVPSFTYENFEGGTTSLTDFIGSYVYINLWATWSKPSENEIKRFSQIAEEFSNNKNIVFINLSIDDHKNYSKWRERVENENLKGIQLIASDGWDSEFLKNLKITHIPCAVIIDPKGDVVEIYTFTPSNPKLKEELYKLLENDNK